MSSHKVFTDGACSGNPGPGGWGAYWIDASGKESEFGGGKDHTTNNEMELTAVVQTLERLKEIPGALEIHTDSQYVQRGITEWIKKWEARGWKNSDNKPVKNLEHWKALLALVRARAEKPKFIWVRGHDGNKGNERADRIARSYVGTSE